MSPPLFFLSQNIIVLIDFFFKKLMGWIHIGLPPVNRVAINSPVRPSCTSMTLFFFWIRGNLTPRKAHFVGLGEGVKPRLSQALTIDARPNLNSRPAVQISNSLPSRYASWGAMTLFAKYFPSNLFLGWVGVWLVFMVAWICMLGDRDLLVGEEAMWMRKESICPEGKKKNCMKNMHLSQW